MLTTFSFIVLGILSLALSIFVITRKWPVTAAMFLIVVMMLLAGMYGLMNASFPAVAQIIVYAGAIMVVFVFVIMLLNVPPARLNYSRLSFSEMILVLLGVGSALFLGTKVGFHHVQSTLAASPLSSYLHTPFYPTEFNVKNVSSSVFVYYLWAFELLSLLILVAIIGATVIAKKRKTNDA